MKLTGNMALTDINEIKKEVGEWLFDNLDGKVNSGPFAGMKLINKTAWKETCLSPLLLGCYEEELHGAIEQQIDRLQKLTTPRITVVGAAEGYYPIGLKRRIPHAQVFGIDRDDAALRIMEAAAILNGVEIIIKGQPEDYLRADFIVMDVEGNELCYLVSEQFPSLIDATILVEIHDFTTTKDKVDIGNTLVKRFMGSHRIIYIEEGPRNPNRFPFLQKLKSEYRWAAVSEGRPCLMGWFVMEPKGRLVT